MHTLFSLKARFASRGARKSAIKQVQANYFFQCQLYLFSVLANIHFWVFKLFFIFLYVCLLIFFVRVGLEYKYLFIFTTLFCFFYKLRWVFQKQKRKKKEHYRYFIQLDRSCLGFGFCCGCEPTVLPDLCLLVPLLPLLLR